MNMHECPPPIPFLPLIFGLFSAVRQHSASMDGIERREEKRRKLWMGLMREGGKEPKMPSGVAPLMRGEKFAWIGFPSPPSLPPLACHSPLHSSAYFLSFLYLSIPE